MTNEEALKELKKISKILMLAQGEQLEKELGKVATTDDRKRIWVWIDGKLTSKDISEQTGIPLRTVQYFLLTLEKAELIENPWGKPPYRVIDYVPPSWVKLVKILEKTEEKEEVA